MPPLSKLLTLPNVTISLVIFLVFIVLAMAMLNRKKVADSGLSTEPQKLRTSKPGPVQRGLHRFGFVVTSATASAASSESPEQSLASAHRSKRDANGNEKDFGASAPAADEPHAFHAGPPLSDMTDEDDEHAIRSKFFSGLFEFDVSDISTP